MDARKKRELKTTFRKYDRSGTGDLSIPEFTSFLKAGNPKISRRECEVLFKDVDKDGNGVIDFDEFVEYLFPEGAAALAAPTAQTPAAKAAAAKAPAAKAPAAKTQAAAGSSGPPAAKAASRGPKAASKGCAMLDKYVVLELKSLPNMHQDLLVVLQAIAQLLGEPPVTDAKSAQKFLAAPGFVDRCNAIARSQPDADAIGKARAACAPLGADASEAGARLKRVSAAAHKLHAWLVGVFSTVPSARGHPQCGLSVRHIAVDLIGKMAAVGLQPSAEVKEMEPVVIRPQGANVVCPRDDRLGAAYVDSVGEGPDDIGLANFMLSYSWGYKVEDVASTLSGVCKTRGLDASRTYIWMCCACINQHRVLEKRNSGETVPFDEFRRAFKDRVESIGHIIAMMQPWHAPGYLTRVWCDFELYSAHLMEREITIAMPQHEHEAFLQALRTADGMRRMWDAFESIDVEKAQASVSEDRENIIDLVRESPGIEAFNNMVARHLLQWIVSQSASSLDGMFDSGAEVSLYDLLRGCSDICWVFRKIGEPGRALDYMGRGLFALETRAAELPDEDLAKLKTTLLFNRADVRRSLGDADGASRDDALAAACGGAPDDGSWEMVTKAAKAKMDSRDFAGASEDFKRAIALHVEAGGGESQALAGLQADLANCMIRLGDHAFALDLYEKARAGYERTCGMHSSSGVTLLTNMGGAKQMARDFEGASAAFGEALDILRRTGTIEGLHGGQLLLNIAISAWNQQNAKKAFENAEEACAVFERIGHEAHLTQARQVVDLAKQHLPA